MATEFDDDTHYGLFFGGGALTSGTSFKVRQSELTLAAMRAAGLFGNMVDGTSPPTTDKLWLDKNTDPAVLKEWDSIGSAWMPMTFERVFERAAATVLAVTGGTANNIVVNEPSIFISNRLYSVSPSSANSGATTITVTGVGTFPVRYLDGTPIVANELAQNRPSMFVFRNGGFDLLNGYSAQAAAEAARDIAVAAAASVTGTISGVEVVKTNDYTIVPGDIRKTIVANSATAIEIALADVTEFDAPFQVRVFNSNIGPATVKPTGAVAINGAATLVLAQNETATIWLDATEAFWRADVGGSGSAPEAVNSHVVTSKPLAMLRDQDYSGAIHFYTQGYEPNNIFQGFYHDVERGLIYVGVQHTDGSGNVVFARIDMDGNFIDKSALHSTVIGKNVFGVEKLSNGDRKLWARDAVGWSLTRFDYVVDGQGANVQTYRVEDDTYYVTAWLSRSGKYVLVNGRQSSGSGGQRARVYLRETLVNGGPGDYRGQHISAFSMAPDVGESGVMQGVFCDDVYAYGVYGGNVLSEAKYVRVYNLLTGAFVGKVEMTVGKAEASFEGSGNGFEYEGIGAIVCEDGIERLALGSRSGQGGGFRNNRIWVIGGLPSRDQRNLLDNGALHEWQRGTSRSTTGGFLPDRFFCARQGSNNVLWERDTDVPAGLKAPYAIKATGTSTSTDVYMRWRLAASETAKLPRCFNVSAYFKRSAINGGFNIRVRQNPTADDWTNSVQTRIKTVTATGTDYVRIDIPVSMSSADISNGLEFRFQATNVQNGEVIKFAGLQITKGSVVTAFDPIDKAENKDRCDRYFERLGGDDLPPFTPVASGFLSSATLARFNVPFKEKRVLPSIAFSGRPRVQGAANYTPADASGMTASIISRKSALVDVVTVGLTAGQGVILDTSNLASNYLAIDVSAEP